MTPDAPPTLRLGRRIWRYLTEQPRRLALIMLLYPLGAMVVVLPPYLVQQLLDGAMAAHDRQRLLQLGLLYLAALVAEYVIGFVCEYQVSVLGQRALAHVRRDLFAHLCRLDARYFDRHPSGRILSRLTSDVEAMGDLFTTGAITMVADVLTLVAVLGAMLWLNVRLTLTALWVVPPLVLLTAVFQRLARRAFRRIRRHIAAINAFLVEHIGGMVVVQAFGQEARTQAEFDVLGNRFRDANREAIFVDAALYAIVEGVATAAVALLIWRAAAAMAWGSVSAGTLVGFIQYIRRFFVPIRDLSTKYTVLQSALAAAERIDELLVEPIRLQSPVAPQSVAGLPRVLALEHVWFAYDDLQATPRQVLRDVSLTVQAGERVALVGHTGSGKSTVLKLLGRSYDVQRGRVSLGGVDVQALDLVELRRLFAVVLQDVHLFSGTILHNLTLGGRLPVATAQAAARAVGAEPMIQRLGGYEATLIELAQNLSAGERQLLALARALALDPEIFILDEATSNVDSETEAVIQQALKRVMAGRTSVVVAHRLATVQQLDRIVVLHQGEVVQSGSHAELLREPGIYRRLVALQMGESG